MSGVRPRALVHRGVVEAGGLLFDPALLGEGEARRRVLALWTAGAAVYGSRHGLVLRLAAPRHIACDRALGLPLVRTGAGPRAPLASAPLTPEELRALDPPDGCLLLVHEGVVERLQPSAEHDLSTWIDLGGWQSVETATLGAPPPPPEVVAPPAAFDHYAKLGASPPAAERNAVLAAIRARAEAGPGTAPGRGFPFWEGARAGLHSLTDMLRSALQKGRGAGEPGASGHLPTLASKLMARAMLLTRLSSLIGRQHAQYFGRMLELFERGDLAEALRHAIPLGGEAGEDTLPFLRFLSARNDLRITPRTAPDGGSVFGAPDLLEYLRSLYRQAFQRLEQAGRIEEAAFVLAELLKAEEEAVAFLERHGKLRLAAELAEGRDLAPGLVVRQWFVAGDWERAVAVARRTGSFADAVTRLEKGHPELARHLRLLWAACLVQSGQYAGAVQAVWPIREARPEVLEWIDRAIDLGGEVGARMLAWKLTLVPGTEQTTAAKARALLVEEGTEAAAAHLAFAEALVEDDESVQSTGPLARDAARALLRDAGLGHCSPAPALLRQLVALSRDAAFRADLPTLPKPQREPLDRRADPLEVRIEAGDTGTVPILDAGYLAGGRCVVALGEAGIRLLSRAGHTAAHLDQPAHRLVLSDHGAMAIVLAPRGEVYRLARLDFAAMRARHWYEADLVAFAPDFDGSLWFAATRQGLLAVDALAARFTALWRNPEIPGVVTAVARSSSHCSFLSREARPSDAWGRPSAPVEEWVRWTMELPRLILRHRTPLPPLPDPPFELRRSVSAAGRVAEMIHVPMLSTDPTGPGRPRPSVDGTYLPLAEWSFPPPLEPVLNEQWLLMPLRERQRIRCFLFDRTGREPRAVIDLCGSTHLSARLSGETLTLADDLGRLLVLRLQDGEVLRNLRI